MAVLVLWRCRRRGRGQQLTIIKTAKRRRRVADPQAVGAQPYFWWTQANSYGLDKTQLK